MTFRTLVFVKLQPHLKASAIKEEITSDAGRPNTFFTNIPIHEEFTIFLFFFFWSLANGCVLGEGGGAFTLIPCDLSRI